VSALSFEKIHFRLDRPGAEQKFCGLSLALHLSAFLLLVLLRPRSGPPVPQGVFVTMATLPAPALAPTESSRAQAVPLHSAPLLHRKKKKAAAPTARPHPAAAPGQVGNSHSGAAKGQVGAPDGEAATAKARYLYELHLRIDQRKRYPPIARSLGQQGVVRVAFRIAADGSVSGVTLESPSTYGNLNRAALQLIESLGRVDPPPPGTLEPGGFLDVDETIGYRLL
jgi:TonB family protein